MKPHIYRPQTHVIGQETLLATNQSLKDIRHKVRFWGMLWEPYPPHHNGLLSPLLVLRDFAAKEADQSRSDTSPGVG